jgi:hypothetical protein
MPSLLDLPTELIVEVVIILAQAKDELERDATTTAALCRADATSLRLPHFLLHEDSKTRTLFGAPHARNTVHRIWYSKRLFFVAL